MVKKRRETPAIEKVPCTGLLLVTRTERLPWNGQVEGDVLPFPMTPEQRRVAIEKLAGGPKYQTAEYDGVQLFRAKKTVITRWDVPEDPPAPQTRVCRHCGGRVKLKKQPKVKPDLPQKQRWWLYYGPGRMTGGFATKKEAMGWYLRGGR